MAYSAYNSTIFQSASANTACNKIIQSLQSEFGVEQTNQDFALSGAAASFLQVPTDANDIKNISFVTTNMDMYAYLVAELSGILNPFGIVAYREVIQIVVAGNVYIEVWMITTTLNRETRYGIEMQLRSEIPENLLTYYQPSGNLIVVRPPMINISGQLFNPGASSLYSRSWSFNPDKINVSWVQGQPVPNNIMIDTIIKNYSNDSIFGNYSDFQIEVKSNTGKGNGLLSPFYRATIDGGTVYSLGNNALRVNIDVEFIDFQLIDEGKYNANIGIHVSGIDSRTAVRTVFEVIFVPIELSVVSQNNVFVKPNLLEFEHVISQVLPGPKEFVVNDEGTYRIKYSKDLIIKGNGLIDESTRDISIKKGTGVKTLLIGLDRSVEGNGLGVKSYSVSVISANVSNTIKINVSLLATGEINIDPKFLEFEAVKGVREALPQGFRISSPMPYNIDYDGWIAIRMLKGVLGESFEGLIDPADSDNFAPGVYKGAINIKSDVDSVKVPITYTIKASSFSVLLPDRLNFTKDQIFVNLATKFTGVYLRAILSLTWFSFKGIATTVEYPQHIPIFNGKAEFYPGEVIHNILDNLLDIEQFIPNDLQAITEQPFSYYQPAVLDISMQQRKYGNDVIVATQEINNLLFVKGTKPLQFDKDTGIMLSDYPVRVTPNSYGIVNFTKRSGLHNIEIHVNGKMTKTIQHDTVTDSVFGMIISFIDYMPGDLVYLKIKNEYDGYYERRFYVFPENKETYHVAWVTEHEQLELLEFTGGYSIETEYERVENNVYRNLVNVKEILQTDKFQPLTANTGWLLKDNHVLLDSLMRAKRAWLFLPNTDYKIALVPQGKKLSNYDSDRATYAYDVEFTINPDNDAKVYPR